ncbi:MAG TPA: GIY-YIG nuclease family protein [Clostridia bacterium]|nr:GIY-YIG nuclease family protein [Clostridia bacterium]
MTYCVYAIKSKTTGRIYIGQTSKLEQRIQRHNQILPTKRTSFTFKNQGPWVLIYKEEFANRVEAIRREKELKSFRGREFIKKLAQR